MAVPQIFALLNEVMEQACRAAHSSRPSAELALPVMRDLLFDGRVSAAPLKVYFAYLDVVSRECRKELRRSLDLSAKLGEWGVHLKLRRQYFAARWHLFWLRALGWRYRFGGPIRPTAAAFDRKAAAILSLM